MTFPGADTINEGIMGVDCFRTMCGLKSAGIESMGESSGVWVPWEEAEDGDLRLDGETLSSFTVS
jgi:hypothetical protein